MQICTRVGKIPTRVGKTQRVSGENPVGNSLEHKKMSESWRAHAGDLSEHERLYLSAAQIPSDCRIDANNQLVDTSAPQTQEKKKKTFKEESIAIPQTPT